jgi:indole-3-glycerol phosphate synthase
MIAAAMTDVLSEIVAQKHKEIAAAKCERPFDLLAGSLHSAPPVRDFVGALRASGGMGLIAEVKKASPSAGVMQANFDPVATARAYAAHGAHCISVLTDEKFFQGRLDYLRAVRASVAVPVLRKDFLLDRYQVLEARVAGADCVLLIAECLDTAVLQDLYGYALELGMSALVEIYEPGNLDRVLDLRPALLGVNNRNLKTFVTDLGHTIGLAKRVPDSTLLISESGIRNRADVARLQSAGVRGILVGETLMRSPDVASTIRELVGAK